MSFICILLGIYPEPLYRVLPYEIHYNAYHLDHVVTQLQLLMFSALVFFLFLPLLKRTETISLDTDWFYRKGSALLYRAFDRGLNGLNELCEQIFAIRLVNYLKDVTSTTPQKTAEIVMVPIWKAMGYRGEGLEQKRSLMRKAIKIGAIPVGLSAGIALIFIVAISIFI